MNNQRLFTVCILIGELPYMFFDTFKTREEAIGFARENYNMFSKAPEVEKTRVNAGMDVYLTYPENDDDLLTWCPWWSGCDFRMQIKPIDIT